MRFGIFSKKKIQKELAVKKQAAAQVHAKNIKSIVQSRQTAIELKKTLEKNQIIIQIAGAIGHSR